MSESVKKKNGYLKGTKGFKKTKIPFDEGYQIPHRDGGRTHRHTGMIIRMPIKVTRIKI